MFRFERSRERIVNIGANLITDCTKRGIVSQDNTQRVAVDIGGTFVDAITFDRETRDIALEKAATTPNQPSEGVIESVNGVDADLESANAFVHGTTLGLNAVLERDGARTGIITNEG